MCVCGGGDARSPSRPVASLRTMSYCPRRRLQFCEGLFWNSWSEPAEFVCPRGARESRGLAKKSTTPAAPVLLLKGRRFRRWVCTAAASERRGLCAAPLCLAAGVWMFVSEQTPLYHADTKQKLHSGGLRGNSYQTITHLHSEVEREFYRD